MSGVMDFENGEVWLVAGWVWRMLIDRATDLAHHPVETETLVMARDTQGLSFELLDRTRSEAVARLLSDAVNALVNELSNASARDPALIEKFLELRENLNQQLALLGRPD